MNRPKVIPACRKRRLKGKMVEEFVVEEVLNPSPEEVPPRIPEHVLKCLWHKPPSFLVPLTCFLMWH
ncbi:hypothetical protein HHI36_005196, partial [Cryptolaemus montrouzieri]